MKYIILLPLIVFNALCAETFTTEKNLNFKTLDYQIIPTIIINIEDITTINSKRTALININGHKISTQILITSQESSYDTTITSYEAIIHNVELTQGSICDESESLNYIVYFDQISNRDPHAPYEYTLNSIHATRKYYWDVCHDLAPVLETIKYTKVLD